MPRRGIKKNFEVSENSENIQKARSVSEILSTSFSNKQMEHNLSILAGVTVESMKNSKILNNPFLDTLIESISTLSE